MYYCHVARLSGVPKAIKCKYMGKTESMLLELSDASPKGYFRPYNGNVAQLVRQEIQATIFQYSYKYRNSSNITLPQLVISCSSVSSKICIFGRSQCGQKPRLFYVEMRFINIS